MISSCVDDDATPPRRRITLRGTTRRGGGGGTEEEEAGGAVRSTPSLGESIIGRQIHENTTCCVSTRECFVWLVDL